MMIDPQAVDEYEQWLERRVSTYKKSAEQKKAMGLADSLAGQLAETQYRGAAEALAKLGQILDKYEGAQK